MTKQEHNREESSHATFNWVEVRNQAAIAAMQSIINSNTFRQAIIDSVINLGELPYIEIAECAINFADALVEELKGE